jgi:hypothetical protein
MNRFVKRILGMVLSERREAGENPNWTEVLGSVAATINSQHGRGKYEVSSYEAVFGHRFNHALSCSKDEARRCWTLSEHMQITNDLDFKKYVHEYFDVDSYGDDTDEDDSRYFSDDDIPSDETEEVDDDYFNMHLMDDSDSSTPPDVDSSVTVSDVFAQPNVNCVDHTKSQSDVITVDEGAPTTAEVNNNDDEEAVDVWDESWVRDFTLNERQNSRTNEWVGLYSIAEEWERQRQLERPVDNENCLCCRLICDLCSRSGITSIKIPNSQYEHRLRYSTDWYRSDFIAGFATLAQHDAHITTPNYKSSDRVLLVFTPYPKNPVSEILPYGNITHFLSVVWNDSHYAVLYYDIDKRTVTVFDGLNIDISNWQEHIIHTIKTYGLKPLFSSATCKFQYDVYVDERVEKRSKSEKRDMTLEISFDDLKEPWHVKNEQSYVQGDGVSCGPIACLKVMEIYGFIPEGSIETIRGYRHVVMDYFNECVSRYDNVLKVAVRTKKYQRGKQPNSGDDDVDSKVAATDSASELPVEVVTAAELVSVNREIAMTKRNKRQAASALKEIKRCGIAAIKSGAEVGAVCTLKVDYRTHSHAQGLIAIVYDVKTTGSILVCCDHGVITHSGTKAEYWVPVDKYSIVARKDEGCPLPAYLADVRQMVLSGKFDPKPCPRISYSKLHERSIDATSPVKRGKGCKCKNGVCVKACGCKKKGVSCHSGCSCNGNCCGV